MRSSTQETFVRVLEKGGLLEKTIHSEESVSQEVELKPAFFNLTFNMKNDLIIKFSSFDENYSYPWFTG